MQYKILIVGAPTPERQEMQAILARNKLYGVDVAVSSSRAIELLNGTTYQLTIFNFESLTQNTVRTANYFFELFGHIPLMVAAKSIPTDGVRLSAEKKGKIIFLEKPYDEKDLYGIVDKMVQGRTMGQRVFRRYDTSQVAKIARLNENASFLGKVCNLSRGGAYFEHTASQLTVGDFVSLNVDLREVARSYSVNAKVVWTSDKSDEGRLGVGVEFIKANDVYRNLLSRLA